MKTENSEFHLSDNEEIVRNYECTKRPRLFGTPVVGYLTVTNKRVVYHSQAKSRTGSSSVNSELPLNDVSGLSASVSTSFNWIFFAIFSLTMYFATFLVAEIFPPFLTGWVVSILLLLPYLIALLIESNILSQEVKQQFQQNLNEIPGIDFFRNKEINYLGIFRFIFFIGLALAAWNIAKNSRMVEFSLIALVLLGLVYFWIFRAIFGNIRNFNLAISSQSPKNAGIVIPGNPLALLFGGDTAAVQSLFSSPGNDAELIVSELGAILTDIKHMGDLGIQKWQQ